MDKKKEFYQKVKETMLGENTIPQHYGANELWQWIENEIKQARIEELEKLAEIVEPMVSKHIHVVAIIDRIKQLKESK